MALPIKTQWSWLCLNYLVSHDYYHTSIVTFNNITNITQCRYKNAMTGNKGVVSDTLDSLSFWVSWSWTYLLMLWFLLIMFLIWFLR